jgi:hypothetical protein
LFLAQNAAKDDTGNYTSTKPVEEFFGIGRCVGIHSVEENTGNNRRGQHTDQANTWPNESESQKAEQEACNQEEDAKVSLVLGYVAPQLAHCQARAAQLRNKLHRGLTRIRSVSNRVEIQRRIGITEDIDVKL